MTTTNVLMVIPRNDLSDKANYSYTFPLGLGYISSVLKTKHKVGRLNLYHCNDTVLKAVTKKLDEKDYDIICTGAIAMQYRVVEQIIMAAKKHRSNPKVLLGGMIVIADSDTFGLLDADFAVMGEGEEITLKLLDYIEKGKNIGELKGIMYKENGKIISTGKSNDIQNLDSLPYPDFSGFDFEKKLDNTTIDCDRFDVYDYPRFYPILGSRGCPFHCTFCYHYSIYRKRSLENVLDELRFAIKKYNINTVMFYDECISLDKNRLIKFCGMIKELRDEVDGNLTWVPQLTVHNIDDEVLKAMKDSGARTVSYGFESFSPKVLKSMRKPITPKMIENAFKKTMKMGMFVQANFIFGDTAETKETAKETLDWWKENSEGQIRLGFIQPYPGSEIYHRSLNKGVIRDKLAFIKDMKHNTWLNMTDGMTDKQIRSLKRELLNAEKKYSKFSHLSSVVPGTNETYEFDVVCPYCKEKVHYKNFRFSNRESSKHNYHFRIVCRNCHLSFISISPLRGFIYRLFPLLLLLIAKDFVQNMAARVKRVKLEIKDVI